MGSKVFKKGFKWVWVDPNGSKWVQMWSKCVQNGSKWVQIGSNKFKISSKWVLMGQIVGPNRKFLIYMSCRFCVKSSEIAISVFLYCGKTKKILLALCENCKIFLSLWFYVKSLYLKNIRVLQLPILQFQRFWIFLIGKL